MARGRRRTQRLCSSQTANARRFGGGFQHRRSDWVDRTFGTWSRGGVAAEPLSLVPAEIPEWDEDDLLQGQLTDVSWERDPAAEETLSTVRLDLPEKLES